MTQPPPPTPAAAAAETAAVVIGRNEGERLIRCLQSLTGQVRQIIYVDSGSCDGSVEAARNLGAEVVELDTSRPFTAARARNAGLAAVATGTEYVQFTDGDCEVVEGWIATAHAFMEANPQAAVVCGRRREQFPSASVYNRLCDAEWDTPVGPAKACGGDALMRLTALRDAGGYRDELIAGEEPELCLRLRRAGWEIWRLDAEMTRHDARMLRFSQWWQRSRRAGHAFAEGAALHGASPERHWVTETRRALIWGAILPVAILIGAAFSVWVLLLALIYPAQLLRLVRRMGWERGAFTLLGKFPEAVGVLEYHLNRRRGRSRTLLEYK